MAWEPTARHERVKDAPGLRVPRFVGRHPDLRALGDALAVPPAVVLVEGEAGIGKTRLVQEFLLSEAGCHVRALVACCPPFRQPHTLGPMVDAIRLAVGPGVAGLRLSGLAGALRPLFPEWGPDLPSLPEPIEDATASRHRVFGALTELLERLGVVLLVLEDAHWADEATLEYLLFLTSRRVRSISLVVTYRPEDVPEDSLLLRLSSQTPADTARARVALGPLDVSGTALLVSSMLDDAEVSDSFAAFLHARTDGIPLAVEESVRLMGDRADLARRSHRWMRRRLERIEVPPTVRDAVLARAVRLSEAARLVLKAVAVLAGPSQEEAIGAVAGLPARQTRAGLAEALRSRLLTDDGHGRVAFRHVLAEQAIYGTIPAPERRLMHLRAGKTTECTSPPLSQCVRLTRHFREAGDTARWLRYGEQAADLALTAGDEATASALLHELVTAGHLGARDAARLTNKIPLVLLAGSARHHQLVSALRSIADAGGLEPGEEAEVRCQLGRLLVAMDDWAAAHTELTRAIPGLDQDTAAAVRTMTLLAWPSGSCPWPASEHLKWLRRAAGAAAAMTPAERLLVLVNRATALLLLGEEDGWTEVARIPADADTARERLQIARGYLNVGEMAVVWGRYQRAREWLTRGAELAQSHQYLRLKDAALGTLTHLDWFTGRWDDLARRAALIGGDEEVQPMTRLEAELVAGLVRATTDSPADAAERLRSVLEEIRRSGCLERAMEPAAALARLALAEGETGEALRVTREPAEVMALKGTWLWAADLAPVRIEALGAAGRVEEAAEFLRTFAWGVRGRDAPAAAASLASCKAVLAAARGQRAEAVNLYARSAALWHALPRPYDALRARERQARCLLDIGQAEAGLAVLSEARAGFGQLGAARDAERVSRVLRGHGVAAPRSRGGRRGYGDHLSPRELEVVRLVLTGRSNREIAEALCRSRETVSTQVKSAMRKLGVSSRAALAVSATSAGITPGERLSRLAAAEHSPITGGTIHRSG